MNLDNSALGATITRSVLGLVMLAHSAWLKGVVFTLPGTAQYFSSIGLPAGLAYIVFVVEVVAGIALILGFRTRIAALAIVPILIGASWAHWSNGWLFTNTGGGWEYPALLAVLAIAQAFLGDGAHAITDRFDIETGDRHARADSAA